MTSSATNVRFGIRTRLFLAFATVASMSVLAGIVGWLSYDRLSRNLEQIADIHLPALDLAAQLAETGGAIIATAPILLTVQSEDQRVQIRRSIDRRLGQLAHLIGQIELARPGGGNAEEPSLAPHLIAIEANLVALDANVRQRLALARQNAEAIEHLRWLQADFLDEIEPLVDDARFNIERAISILPGAPGRGAQMLGGLRDETLKTEAVLQTSATGNLALGLIARSAALPSLEGLERNAHFLAETVASLEQSVKALEDWPDAITVEQIAKAILAMADGPDSLPSLRHREVTVLLEGQRLLEVNRELVARLNEGIARQMDATREVTQAAAAEASLAIATGRRALLLVAVLSLMVALGVAWFYVNRNIIARLTSLGDSARAIAAGDLAVPIHLGGRDEISEMAAALEVFRDTAVKVEEKTLDLQRTNRRLQHEIAEHRRTEQHLREAQAELVQAGKLAALGQLAAGVGHELNQPLAAIRHFARNGSILIGRGQVEDARQNLEKISELTGRMAGITNHLKRFTRRPDTRLGPVRLQAVIDAALDLFANRLHQEMVALECSREPELTVQGEEVRLEQVFVNLISNALDAIGHAPVRRLRIWTEEHEDKVVVKVGDSGGGIAPEHLRAVFDPFFTTKEVGAGLGLGLSISYNIIKDFGGTLSVAETGPQGTVFALTLQRA
ncbi:ATP-binding protein [Telmatospirillum sp. J64-1]|uniref:ATP-binding protein n=1 Tax=Telmatospirillum sp. J64-1 TaxID=2502183 RepID=UPI00115E5B0A|nr:ATP-binding protein [Telmatospirillum sp. J64-1]